MYSFSDTERIYKLARVEKNVGNEYPELSDISNILCAILYRTAFYSKNIDENTSHYSINYMIEILKSIDKEDLALVDHHLIDSFTYPYVSQVSDVVNGLKTIFKPHTLDDDFDYISSFTKIFGRLCSIRAAEVEISKYKNFDMLVDTFSSYMINSTTKRNNYALMQLIMAYLYKNVDNLDKETLIYIFDMFFYDDYYLSKINLNTAIPLNEVLDGNINRVFNKEDILDTYNYISYIINQILNNIELDNAKKVIR